MTKKETRIAFAERQGWTKCQHQKFESVILWHLKGRGFDIESNIPDPTNHNHVHIALMGMSDEEWKQFSSLLLSTGEGYWNGGMENIVTLILKLPLSTLVECYLEATKGRVK